MNYMKRLVSNDNISKLMGGVENTDEDLQMINMLIINPMLLLLSIVFIIAMIVIPFSMIAGVVWLGINVSMIFYILLVPILGLIMMAIDGDKL